MSKIVEKFRDACMRHADKTAVYFAEHERLQAKSYREFAADVESMASFLYGEGVRGGSRILTFCESDYRLCVYMTAAMTMGASVMYVDIHTLRHGFSSVFDRFNPDFVLVSDKTRKLLPLFGSIKNIRRINIGRANDTDYPHAAKAEPSENTVALITVTTGSTGVPKLFLRSHGDLLNQLELIIDNLGKKRDEVVLTTSYIYVFANLLQGFTTVLPCVNSGSGRVSKAVRRLSVFRSLPISMIFTTPDFCLNTPNIYPELRELYFGGAILNIHEAQAIRSRYPDCLITYIYGSTECSLIARNSLDNYIAALEEHGECELGEVCRGVSVRILNGRIFVSSKALLTRSDVEIDLKDGYYDTNDAGYTRGGKLYFSGKDKFALNIGGERILPNIIEQKLCLRFREIPKCAIIQDDRGFILFVECSPKREYADYLYNSFGITPRVKRLRRIPRDRKHHTKTDYNKLINR